MRIVLNTGESYKLSELAKATENAPDDLFYLVKQVDGQDVSFAITREQLLQGISGGSATWGSIDGDILNQSDLQTEFTSIDDRLDGLEADLVTIETDIEDLQSKREEAILGTALYNGSMSGTIILDLDAFSDYYGILTAETNLQTINTPSEGFSIIRSFTIVSDNGENLNLPESWNITGTYKTDGTENDIEVKFTNYPTVGLKVICNINN